MSRGPGKVERRLTDLFLQVVDTDRILTVSDLGSHVFGCAPTRAQRISVLRAAHRIMKRARSHEDFWFPLKHLRVTERADGTLAFHDWELPVRVWAIQIRPQGVVWSEASITSITPARVNVTYRGVRVSLDRSCLFFPFARWRGVFFVNDRNGYGAKYSKKPGLTNTDTCIPT